MDWIADTSPGDWLRDRLDATWTDASSMHTVVPRGFPAYARIFHPASRSRPVGQPWPPLPYDDHARAWAAFGRSQPQIDTENVTWAQTAATFGTQMHPEAQWNRIVGAHDLEQGWQQVRGPEGWQYDAPGDGRMDVAQLAMLARLLAAATTTPHHGYAGVWEGYGGLVGFMGETPSRAVLTFSADPTVDDAASLQDRHRAMLEASTRDPFNNVFRKPTWQPGILSDEISRGPRLELPQRAYVLFAAGVTAFTDASWPDLAPWVGPDEAHAWAQSPNVLWPADRSWAVVSEIDFDSTVIAGSAELIAAIFASPGLEALPLREGADLTWDGDSWNGNEVNR